MMELHHIDQDDKIPYYLQVKDRLQELIDQQTLKPGDKLPSEVELCEGFGVSRTVIRQALQELEYEGLVRRRKGIGSFVAEPKVVETFVQKLSGFAEDMATQKIETHARVLRNETIPATARVAEYLGLAPETLVVVLERLRFVGQEPVQISTSYMPYSLCRKVLRADFTHQSLYEFLAEHGFFLVRGYRTIEAVRANEMEASLMEVDIGTPMLMIDSVGYLEDGTPIEYYHAIHRGDRTRFRVELMRTREQRGASGSIFQDIDHTPFVTTEIILQ